MYFEIFGVPMDFSPKNVTIALIITTTIFVVVKLFQSFNMFAPFKGDKLANESLYFIFMIHHDYFKSYSGFLIEDKEFFCQKLCQIASIYDVRRMQEESYRIQFQSLLQRHHGLLKEAYCLFEGLNHIPILKRTDVVMVVKRTNEILNQIIYDINEEFKDLRRTAV